MAAPIPSNLLFVSAGIDFLQSNPLNWVLQSDGVTPSLRVPVATDTVFYQDVPTDSIIGFQLQPFVGTLITGTGNVFIQATGSVTLLAGGISSLALSGTSGGNDWKFLGTSPSSRLLWSGTDYAESGDGSGNIQNTDFSDNLDVERNVSPYDSIMVGGDFRTTTGLDNEITNIEVVGTSTYTGGDSLVNGIFHGLATTDYPYVENQMGGAFAGTFYGGQAVSNVPSYGTLYDQQYVNLQVNTANGSVIPFPL